MTRLKEQAEALATCLRLQVVDVPDIVAWADRWIAKSKVPDWSVCELSGAEGRSAEDIILRLHEVPGAASPQAIEAHVCAWLRAARESHRLDDRRVAGALCSLGVHLVEDGASVIWSGCFDSELDFVDAGISRHAGGRSREEVLAAMGSVLDRLSCGATWDPGEE